MASVKTAREVEKTVKFWELQASNNLLVDREENEAYLASKAGETYVLFFTDGGEVGLDLSDFNSVFNLKWMEIRTGKTTSKSTVEGGEIVNLKAPGTLEWILILQKKDEKK